MKIELGKNTEKKEKTFRIAGELDVHQVKLLRSEVMGAIEEGEWKYIIDMAGIEYLDSSGLGMLVFLKKELLRKQSQLVLLNLQEPVLSVFKLTKLDDFFGLA